MNVSKFLAVCCLLADAIGCSQSEQVRTTSKPRPAASAQDADAPGADPIRGKWKITEAIVNGEPFPKQGEQDAHVGGFYEFDSGKLTKRPNAEFKRFELPVTRHTYTLKSAMNPPQIDVQEEPQDSSAKSWPIEKIIYQLQDDQLTLCWSLDLGDPRPQDFQTREGDNKGLYVLKRMHQ